jgi:hypothetical protein
MKAPPVMIGIKKDCFYPAAVLPYIGIKRFCFSNKITLSEKYLSGIITVLACLAYILAIIVPYDG